MQTGKESALLAHRVTTAATLSDGEMRFPLDVSTCTFPCRSPWVLCDSFLEGSQGSSHAPTPPPRSCWCPPTARGQAVPLVRHEMLRVYILDQRQRLCGVRSRSLGGDHPNGHAPRLHGGRLCESTARCAPRLLGGRLWNSAPFCATHLLVPPTAPAAWG